MKRPSFLGLTTLYFRNHLANELLQCHNWNFFWCEVIFTGKKVYWRPFYFEKNRKVQPVIACLCRRCWVPVPYMTFAFLVFCPVSRRTIGFTWQQPFSYFSKTRKIDCTFLLSVCSVRDIRNDASCQLISAIWLYAKTSPFNNLRYLGVARLAFGSCIF